VARPDEVEPIDRETDSASNCDSASSSIQRSCHKMQTGRARPQVRNFRWWRPILVAATAIMLGGTIPAAAAPVSPLLSFFRTPNHGASTSAWISSLPGIIAIVAGFATILGSAAAIAAWWSGRRTRREKIWKHIEPLRNDPVEQARLIREAEELILTIVVKVNGIHAEVSAMADIRDRASIDPGRRIRLDSTAFSLQRSLFDDYKFQFDRYYGDLKDLKHKLTQCQEAMRPIVSVRWQISPTDISGQLIFLENSRKRLAGDVDLVLNEASRIVTDMLKCVHSLKDQMASGGDGTGAVMPS
jgi:hypothetical protein